MWFTTDRVIRRTLLEVSLAFERDHVFETPGNYKQIAGGGGVLRKEQTSIRTRISHQRYDFAQRSVRLRT